MSSRFEAFRQARFSKLLAAGVLIGTLVVVGVCLSVLSWPRFASSGWLVGGLLALGGAAGNLLLGGKGLPDATDPASSVRAAIGTLVVLACLFLAAAGGF